MNWVCMFWVYCNSSSAKKTLQYLLGCLSLRGIINVPPSMYIVGGRGIIPPPPKYAFQPFFVVEGLEKSLIKRQQFSTPIVTA